MRIAFAVALTTLLVTPITSGYSGSAGPHLWIDDFVQYWSAGRLTIDGANPYDPRQIMDIERLVNPSMPVTIMMWNPPWTLSLIMPFSLLDYRTARTVWALIQMALVIGSAGWLWHFYGGQASTACLVALAALLFPAALISLGIGQISPVVLFGLCAFFYFEERGRDMSAGVAAAMTLVKPHLVYLVWAAILLWSIHRRRWGVLTGAALATTALMIAPELLDRNIVRQYLDAMNSYPPDYYLAPTAGTLARLLLGWERYWPQFLPNLIGVVWLVWYWWPRRNDWKWKDHLPVILVVSVLASAFGWLFDQVVFLIPTIQLLTRLSRQWRPRRAKAAGMLLVLACMLSIILWPLCIRLIQHPRDSQLARTAMSQALSEPNQFWQVVVLPVFLLSFLIGWKCSPHIASNPKSFSNQRLFDAQSQN